MTTKIIWIFILCVVFSVFAGVVPAYWQYTFGFLAGTFVSIVIK